VLLFSYLEFFLATGHISARFGADNFATSANPRHSLHVRALVRSCARAGKAIVRIAIFLGRAEASTLGQVA
jgi:hypothetical protein